MNDFLMGLRILNCCTARKLPWTLMNGKRCSKNFKKKITKTVEQGMESLQ